MSKIDIHQLDPERQILYILNESGASISLLDIGGKLIEHGISTGTKRMNSLLSNTFRDKRGRFMREGWVHKTGKTYKIMQKGIEHLKSTVLVIDPQSGEDKHETIGHLLSTLSGEVKLCDPYFDEKSYGLLKEYCNAKKIKSMQVIFSKGDIDITKSYKIGRHTIDLKKSKSGIHDRFLIDGNCLYLLGTSLNSMGNKLSFIVNLTVYRKTFDDIFQNYWNK